MSLGGPRAGLCAAMRTEDGSSGGSCPDAGDGFRAVRVGRNPLRGTLQCVRVSCVSYTRRSGTTETELTPTKNLAFTHQEEEEKDSILGLWLPRFQKLFLNSGSWGHWDPALSLEKVESKEGRGILTLPWRWEWGLHKCLVSSGPRPATPSWRLLGPSCALCPVGNSAKRGHRGHCLHTAGVNAPNQGPRMSRPHRPCHLHLCSGWEEGPSAQERPRSGPLL